MFHTMITTAYVIPNIYVFMRIWQLFINKDYRVHYIIVYILLASVYPLSNFFHERETGNLATILNVAGNYILPFYLYLFLSVLVFDILLFINFIFKIIPPVKFRSKNFKIAGLSSILGVSIIVIFAGIINFNSIRTSEYHIEIPSRSSELKQLRIAFAADFHLAEGTNTNFVKRFVKKISDLKPDIMIFGGDIVEGDREDENMIVFEKLLREINPKYGVFTVLGNHEYYSGQDRGNFFNNAGMKVLCDTIMIINNSFNLAGRYDSHFNKRKSVGDLLKSVSDTLPLILVDHRPTELTEVSKTKTDVQLSGHTHNGQMFPINLITKSVYELSWGHMKIASTHFFVTSGIRLWGPPVRTTGKSEIMVIDIVFSQTKLHSDKSEIEQ